jgi:phospholipase A1/A2
MIRRFGFGLLVALVAGPTPVVAQQAQDGGCTTPAVDTLVPGVNVEALRQFDLNGNGVIDAGCESNALQDHVNAFLEQPDRNASDDTGEPKDFEKVTSQIHAYEPVYFVIGNDDTVGLNGKFQISFDFQLFRKPRSLLGKPIPIDNLHFSYSQTSLWDFSENSGPFRDSSYRPRLFYRPDREWRLPGGWLLNQLDIGVGHESNGRDRLASRSIDIAYLRPTFTFGEARDSGSQWFVRPTIYAFLDDAENPNIHNYRGYMDLDVGYNWYVASEPWRAWVTLRKGDRSDFGSLEANLAIALASLPGHRLNGWLLLQYFNGYGESLLAYDLKAASQLRAGIAVMF